MAIENIGLYPIELEVYEPSETSIVKGNEGDNQGRGLLVTLKNQGQIFDSTGITLKLGFKNRLGEQRMYNFVVVDALRGQHKITYPNELIRNNGGKTILFDIKAVETSTNNTLSFSPMKLEVEKTTVTEEGTITPEEESTIVELINEIKAIGEDINTIESSYAPRLNQVEVTTSQTSNRMGAIESEFQEIVNARGTYPNLKARLDADGLAVNEAIDAAKNNFYVNVKKFGAKGDGVTDDAAAIQAAIDYAYTVLNQYNLSGGWMFGGGKVFLPSGKYIIKSTLVLKTNVHLVGESQQSVIIDAEKSTGDYAVTNHTPSANFAECDVSNITFVNKGMYFIQNYNSKIYDVSLFNITLGNKIGLLMRLNVGNYIDRIHAYNCGTAIYISGDLGAGFSTTTYMRHLWIAHCGNGLTLSFDSNGLVTSSIKDSIFEYCENGIYMQGLISGLEIEDVHFEQNSLQAIHAGLKAESNLGLRRIWNDSNGYLFTSRGLGVNERFKIYAASLVGLSGITFQYGTRADLIKENPTVIHTAIPETSRVYNANGDLLLGGAPIDGTWEKGDKVLNNIPNAGGYTGWVCVAPGEPGTWKGYGLIES